MGFLVIIITLALGPTINTANAAIAAHDNVSIMIGMSAMTSFGAPLIILGLLTAGGLFALAGVRGQMAGASIADLLGVVGSVVVVIVGLTFLDSIMDYTWILVAASSGFAVTIYEMIPLLVYIAIIAAAGWTTYKGISSVRRGKKSKKSAVGY